MENISKFDAYLSKHIANHTDAKEIAKQSDAAIETQIHSKKYTRKLIFQSMSTERFKQA